ncbi:flagellar hook-length control protein FliK [Legionella sp. WA2022007384]
MTDLNKAISNLPTADLFSNNLSGSSNAVDGEILTNTVENSQTKNALPNNDLKDTNDFIFLLTHIATQISKHQGAKQNSFQVSEVTQHLSPTTTNSTIDSDEEVLEKTISEQTNEEQSPSVVEDNVAVSWINSQYFQQAVENLAIQDEPPSGQPVLIEMQQEVDVNRLNFQQEYNSSEDRNISKEQNVGLNVLETVQSAEVQTPVQEVQNVMERTLTQEVRQQPAEPALIEHGLLQNEDIILSSDANQIIKNVSLRPEEPTEHDERSENPPSRGVRMKSMSASIPLLPNVNSWESKEGDNEEKQIILQPLAREMGKQNESTLPTQPKPESLMEQLDGVKLPSMVNVFTNEVRINPPVENHARTFDAIPQTLTIPMEIDNPEWSNQFSERITWLGQQEVTGAIIKINPEDLGPLEINIKVINDTASVNITAHNHHVRDIIDQALPKLQAMMAEQGLNLSEVQIDSDSSSGQFSQQNDGTTEQLTHEDEVGVTPLKNKRVIKGLIDYFA